jgi:hypothetical protein
MKLLAWRGLGDPRGLWEVLHFVQDDQADPLRPLCPLCEKLTFARRREGKRDRLDADSDRVDAA